MNTKLKSLIQPIYKNIFVDQNREIFFKGVVGSFIIKFIGVGLLFLSQIILARFCGKDQYGFYTYALSWLVILTIITKLGFETSLLRFIPEFQVRSDWGRLRGIIRSSSQFVTIISIFIVLIGNLTIWMFNEVMAPELIKPLRIMLVVLPFYTLTFLRQATLRAFKNVVLAQLPENIIRPMVLVSIAFLFLNYFGELDSTNAWLSHFVAVLVSFFIGTILLYHKVPEETKTTTIIHDRKIWMNTSSTILLMDGMNVILSQGSIIVLGFYRPAEEIAVFSAAVRIAILSTFILMAINSIAAPMISQLYYANKRDELQSILRFSAKGIAIFTTSTTLLIIMFGKYVLALFGSGFIEGYYILLILLAGQTIKSLMGPASFLLTLTGHQNLTAKVMAVAVLVSMILNFILIPIWGMWGAALATGIILMLWNVTVVIMDVKIVQLDPSVFCLFRKNNRIKVSTKDDHPVTESA
jgi:O-antigen/teichoic acid export membrane protein